MKESIKVGKFSASVDYLQGIVFEDLIKAHPKVRVEVLKQAHDKVNEPLKKVIAERTKSKRGRSIPSDSETSGEPDS